MTTRTIFLLIIASTWAAIHSLALALNLYWHFWWFDLPMHFFGGVVVALTYWAVVDLHCLSFFKAQSFWRVMLFVVAVAIGWEIFEVWAGIPRAADYVLDTAIDLVMGILGGAVGYYLGKSLDTL